MVCGLMLIVAFAHFYDMNTPTKTGFKIPVENRQQTWEEKFTEDVRPVLALGNSCSGNTGPKAL